jgi:hypothetical protein
MSPVSGTSLPPVCCTPPTCLAPTPPPFCAAHSPQGSSTQLAAGAPTLPNHMDSAGCSFPGPSTQSSSPGVAVCCQRSAAPAAGVWCHAPTVRAMFFCPLSQTGAPWRHKVLCHSGGRWCTLVTCTQCVLPLAGPPSGWVPHSPTPVAAPTCHVQLFPACSTSRAASTIRNPPVVSCSGGAALAAGAPFACCAAAPHIPHCQMEMNPALMNPAHTPPPGPSPRAKEVQCPCPVLLPTSRTLSHTHVPATPGGPPRDPALPNHHTPSRCAAQRPPIKPRALKHCSA